MRCSPLMRSSLVAFLIWPAWLAACGAAQPVPSAPTAPAATAPAAPVAPAQPSVDPSQPWAVPDGFRAETIPFPLDFAPTITHKGREELRFAPGFFDAAAPGFWSYAFVWRTDDAAALDAAAVGAELTVYFRGLIDAVDDKHQLAGRDTIAATASPAGPRFAIKLHVIDAFKTKQPIDLVGWGERTVCGGGALWRFVLAPASSGVRPKLEALAAEAVCGQPEPPTPGG